MHKKIFGFFLIIFSQIQHVHGNLEHSLFTMLPTEMIIKMLSENDLSTNRKLFGKFASLSKEVRGFLKNHYPERILLQLYVHYLKEIKEPFYIPLHCLARKNHLFVLQLLKQTVTHHLNDQDKKGLTPLAHACLTSNLPFVQYFTNHQSVDLNTINNKGATPLMICINNGSLVLVKKLLEHKNIDPHSGHPLLLALKKNKFEIFKFIATHSKLDINRCIKGLPILHYIVKKHKPLRYLKLVMEKSTIDVNFKEKATGITPLLASIICKNLKAFNALIANKDVDVNCQDKRGDTPLHYIFMYDRPLMLREIIKHKALDPNTTNNIGDTALISALKDVSICTTMIKLFLHSCPKKKLSQKNKRGRTALYYAQKNPNIGFDITDNFSGFLRKHSSATKKTSG